jgi:hypothetical protein
MTLLKELNPTLEADLKEIDISKVESVIVEDEIVYKFSDEKNREFFGGSIFSPSFESQSYLEEINLDNTGYVQLGISNTALIRQLLKGKTETAYYIIVEKDLALIKHFLTYTDLTLLINLECQRLLFVYGEIEKAEIHIKLIVYSLVGYYLVQPEIINTYKARKKDLAYYLEIISIFKHVLVNHIWNMGNNINDTLIGIDNELKNIKYLLSTPALKDLKGMYKGIPAICVSSGPSLDKQLPYLKEMQGKAIIISAESAFKALLKNDIIPDFVCVLERGENSYTFSFKGVEIPRKTRLVGLSLIDPKIYEMWEKQSIVCLKDNLVHSMLLNKAIDKGSFISGNSVAHLNFMLAGYLGASTIVLIGQDLAFSDDGSHHSNETPYSQLSKEEEEKFSLTMDNNKVVYLDGYYGGKVKSKDVWKQFLYWFEHLIPVVEGEVLNCTEGGANIKGAKNIPFQQFVERYRDNQSEIFTDRIDKINKITNLNEDWSNADKFFEEIVSKYIKLIEDSNQQLDGIEVILRLLNNVPFEDIKDDIVTNFQETELIIRKIIDDEYMNFFYNPILSAMHAKINPISRLSSIERLVVVLSIQKQFLGDVVYFGKELIELIEKNCKENREFFTKTYTY